jgi:hypothetical protein
MNPTENRSAAVFFAELLLPLRYANLRRGVVYLNRDHRRQSYWSEVASRTGGMERLSSHACGVPALLALLGSYWARRNEQNLQQLLPHLEALCQELIGAPRVDRQAEGQVTEFIYPLF